MFNRLFGGGQNKAVAPVSAKTSENVVGAIQVLAEQGELLEKRKEVVEKKIAAELAKAKQYLAQGNKSAAMTAMKKKALLTKQIEGLENNIMRLQEQQNALEAAQMQATTVAAMSHAAKAQKATMAEFNVDKVDKIFEDIQEAADQADEIQQALATPLGGAAAIDEDELAAELAEMEAQQLDEELLQPAPIPTTLPAAAEQLNLPSVPAGIPAKANKKKTAEDELAELEAEMAAHLCQNAASGDGQKKNEDEEPTTSGHSNSGSDPVDKADHHPHDHDPLHGAAYQATHRVSEKITFNALERIADSILGRAAKKVGNRAVEQTAAKTAERIGERTLDRAGERILEGVLEKATKQAGIAAARHAAESGVTKGLERAAEEMLPRAGQRAMESAFERGAMQAFERGAEKTLPRAGEMGAVVAGERIAEQAARHGGVRRGLETVLDRVLIRIGRGITIALPASGSLFVLHLVKEDRKRALLEAEKGNIGAARAFWLAFLCDASDLGAHVVIVTSLLNIHYGIGPHLPHAWLHTAEYGGLTVAVVSTLSAVVGELLSAGVSWPWWDNKESHPKTG